MKVGDIVRSESELWGSAAGDIAEIVEYTETYYILKLIQDSPSDYVRTTEESYNMKTSTYKVTALTFEESYRKIKAYNTPLWKAINQESLDE